MNYFWFLNLFILFNIYNCNIWDNMYSQMKSPYIPIPYEFEIELYNDETTLNQMGSFYIINTINAFKIILNNYEKNKNIDLFINITYNKKKGILEFFNSTDCFYFNSTLIKNFPIIFFLNSFDLLSYFQQTNNSYEYYVSNIFSQNKDKKIKPEDKDFYIKFIIDMLTKKLTNIDIKFKIGELPFHITSYTILKKRIFKESDYYDNIIPRDKCKRFPDKTRERIEEIMNKN